MLFVKDEDFNDKEDDDNDILAEEEHGFSVVEDGELFLGRLIGLLEKSKVFGEDELSVDETPNSLTNVVDTLETL